MAIKISRKTGRILWPACSVASTPLKKMRGIMFKNKFKPLLFDFSCEATHRNSIHSFFCIPFDAVFLDSRKRVVDVIPRIKPWRHWIVSKKPARYLIEAPAGDSTHLKIREGDELKWSNK